MNRVCSIFAQIMKLIPRPEFQQAVKEYKAERHARGFTCYGQFVAMMFCQLAHADSLREICQGLAASEGKLKHLGLEAAPCRSTLAYANRKRPWQVYRTVFNGLLGRMQGELLGTKRKFRFKNRLVSVDSTSIDLCATIFNWAHFKQTKGAVKLHLVLDHAGYLPCFAHITDGKVHDVTMGRKLRFAPGTIVAMDKGYVNYEWWHEMDQDRVYFVTRLKEDLKYKVIQEEDVSNNSPVRKDQRIEIEATGYRPFTLKMRLVTIWDPEKEEELVFLTNQFTFVPETIAAIYKERWQIELFFKALKQLLRVKTFVGTSSNALHIQVWTALITVLLVKYMQFRSSAGLSLSNLVALLRQQLLVYRDLQKWLADPFQAPPAPVIVESSQLALSLN
jgi:hypothetical protein